MVIRMTPCVRHHQHTPRPVSRTRSRQQHTHTGPKALQRHDGPHLSTGGPRRSVNLNAAAAALRGPRCPQRGPRSLLPSPSARLLLHYLKLSLVFICRAGDVASSSTFPSRAVYIREPIWLYKTGSGEEEGHNRSEGRRGSHFTERRAARSTAP